MDSLLWNKPNEIYCGLFSHRERIGFLNRKADSLLVLHQGVFFTKSTNWRSGTNKALALRLEARPLEIFGESLSCYDEMDCLYQNLTNCKLSNPPPNIPSVYVRLHQLRSFVWPASYIG